MLGVVVSGVNLNIVLERETIWMRVFVVVKFPRWFLCGALLFRNDSNVVQNLQNTVVVQKLSYLVC